MLSRGTKDNSPIYSNGEYGIRSMLSKLITKGEIVQHMCLCLGIINKCAGNECFPWTTVDMIPLLAPDVIILFLAPDVIYFSYNKKISSNSWYIEGLYFFIVIKV